MADNQHFSEERQEAKPERRFDRPSVGIVIPVYRHSMLVAEAVQSAISQSLDPPPHAVIVDDGCDFPETAAICRGLAAAHPGQVSYVRRTNGGLSAARNTGVNYLLRRFPGLRAIYFLDADNRLRRDALEGALRYLEQSDQIGWVYPNISMFGVAADYDYGGPYSHLLQRSMNQSEAGSLVRAQVFRDGVRFDETMRQGYEDWSFFLSLSERGWRGEHLDDFGLQYRKRGESMLTDSTRIHAELQSFIRRKHSRAFSLRTLLNLEQSEAPRYAIFIADRGDVVFTTDPRKQAERMDALTFSRRFWNAESEPNRAFFPPFMAVTTQAALDQLNAGGLLPYVFWRLELALNACAFSFLELDPAASDSLWLSEPVAAASSDGAHLRAQIVMTRLQVVREVVYDPLTNWADTLTTPSPSPSSHVLNLHRMTQGRLEMNAPPVVHAIGHALSLLRQSPWREGASVRLTARQPGIMPRWLCYDTLRKSAGAADAPVLPVAASPVERHVGFLLPLFAFGGVEKAAGEAARAFRSRGWRPHLFVGPEAPVRLPDSLVGVFETTTLIGPEIIGSWDPRSNYLGTPMPSLSHEAHQQPKLIGVLGWLDAIVNCHSAGGHSVMSTLRKAGTITLAYQHVVDQSVAGRPTGHPVLGIAFEHAYDQVICCSNTLARWFLSMGMPPSKIIAAPNAPGYPLDSDQAAGLVAARRGRRSDKTLRVLFSGRLDRQKGVERLLKTIDLCNEMGLDIEWRIVGDAVLDTESVADAIRERGAVKYGATYAASTMTGHYAWADVVLLLSRWEGLPLTLLEGMRVGAVPVAADVGAVREICLDGRTGRLIDPASDIPHQAAEILAALAADRKTLAKLSSAAHDLVADRSWGAVFAPVIDLIEERIETRLRREREAGR